LSGCNNPSPHWRALLAAQFLATYTKPGLRARRTVVADAGDARHMSITNYSLLITQPPYVLFLLMFLRRISYLPLLAIVWASFVFRPNAVAWLPLRGMLQ
jgi:hypothetical protein